jgi:hypothetical protein
MFARVALFAHIQQPLFNVDTIEPCRACSQMQKCRQSHHSITSLARASSIGGYYDAFAGL